MSQEKLEQAVENALEQMGVDDDTQKDTTTKEQPKGKEVLQKVEKPEDDDSPELDERTSQALQLLEALEDPKRAKLVVENLARQAGLLSGDMTKKEENKTIRGIKEVIKEKLGDNGSFLANELGDALEEIIQGEIGKVYSKIEEVENQRQAIQFQREYDATIEELKVTNDEANALTKLVDEMPWNGKTPLKNYLTKLVRLHRSEAAEQSHKRDIKERQQRNIQSQAKTQGVESNEERVKKGSANISAREAVLAAMRGEQLD
jgi:hypothetical protein